MPTIDETLKRLADTFTVRDVMLVAPELKCASGSEEAVKIAEHFPDFDVIPIKHEETLTDYYEREFRTTKPIKFDSVISDGTSLIDLSEILEERRFAFVLRGRQIDGYVHFSDLNHHLVKLTFYVILQAVERMALESLGAVHRADYQTQDVYLSHNLDPTRYKQVKKIYGETGEAARSPFSYLNICDLLRLAVKDGTIRTEESVIKSMKVVRDAAAHADENLVSRYDEVPRLAEVKRACLRILAGKS